MNYHQYIVRQPDICGGEPVFSGTRVPLRTILVSLAAGDTLEALLQDFPTLTEAHLRAAIAFAASSATEDLPPRPLPRVA